MKTSKLPSTVLKIFLTLALGLTFQACSFSPNSFCGGTEVGNPTVCAPTQEEETTLSSGVPESSTEGSDDTSNAGGEDSGLLDNNNYVDNTENCEADDDPTDCHEDMQVGTFATVSSGNFQNIISNTDSLEVFSNEADFADFWEASGSNLELPEVDFSESNVAVVFKGPRKKRLVKTKIVAVEATPLYKTLHVEEYYQPLKCRTNNKIKFTNYPYHIVSFAKSHHEIEFSVEKIELPCEDEI